MLELIEKFKAKGNKRLIENTVIFLVLLVILIVVVNTLFTEDSTLNNELDNSNVLAATSNSSMYSDELEMKLKNILSQIEGAGYVDVMVSYLNSAEQIPMYDSTQNVMITNEEDTSGGKRKTEQSTNESSIIYDEKNNVRTPVIAKTVMPEILGVVVVAEGAKDVKVKENIINAIGAVVDVSLHRIQVFPLGLKK